MITVNLEREIIGLALRSGRALRDLDMVRPEHFNQPQAGAVWGLIQRMDASGQPVDAVSVDAQLKTLPKLDRQGIDGAWLYECLSLAPTAANAEYRGKQLVNQAELRRLQEALTRSQQIAAEGVSAVETTELVRAEIDATIPSSRSGRLLADGISDSLGRLREESPVAPTPWADLNAMIGGWRPGALYIVASRPGVGKSILGVQAALDLAKTGPVALNSLEMGEAEIHYRMLAQTSGVNVSKFSGIQSGHDPLDGKWADVETAASELAALPLSVDDRSYLTIADIRGHARSVARNVPLAGIVVDYLQLMGTPRGDKRPRHELVAAWSRELKLLAKEMSCPVIALSQLNRAVESRASGKPSLADLRESGAIEQDADVVLLLHVPEDEDGKPEDNLLNVLVAKNRHGKTGPLVLTRQPWISHLANTTKPPVSYHNPNF